MENRNKKRILIWVLVVLILMNITALGTFIYHKYFNKVEKEEPWNRGRNDNKNPHERVKNFVKRELNLDDTQFEKYCRFKDMNVKNSGEIWENLVRLRQSALEEITKEKPDTLRMDELADSIGYYHKKMQKEMTRHFMAVKRTLKPNQLPKFNEMILNMEKREMRRHAFGKGKSDSSVVRKNSVDMKN